MSEVLVESINPNGNIQAVVENDEQTCYFYLVGSRQIDFGMRALWLRNLIDPPDELDVEAMKAGTPPMNPRPFCRTPQGQPSYSAEALRIVWLPEGNGAALYENKDLVAIIPPWSGPQCPGYCREAVGTGTLAWELDAHNAQVERIARANEYWTRWDDEGYWLRYRDGLLSQVEAKFGQHSNYYAIDGGKWPPKAMLRIPHSSGTILHTIGVSCRPQPMVELASEYPDSLASIELAALLPKSWPEASIQQFGKYLSAQSGLPWEHYTWLGDMHTIPCDSWHNREFEFAMLVDRHPALERLSLESIHSNRVNTLWFLPIDDSERQIAEAAGSQQLFKSLSSNRWLLS